MRIAVMSDIHGYSLALATVMADVEAQGPFDEIVVAGDLVEGGPDPAAVLRALDGSGFTVLRGNTDRDVVMGAEEGWNNGKVRYVLDQVGDAGVAFLASLPFSRRITPPGGASPDDDLLVVHANPYDLERPIAPSLSEREVDELLAGTRAAAIAFGHIHIAYIRQLERGLLVDVSAVGNPKDRDLRCKYGIIAWDETTHVWKAEIRRLGYPLEETIQQILTSGMPNPEKTRKKLEKASY